MHGVNLSVSISLSLALDIGGNCLAKAGYHVKLLVERKLEDQKRFAFTRSGSTHLVDSLMLNTFSTASHGFIRM